jgi:uncharacterized integral membrane protein
VSGGRKVQEVDSDLLPAYFVGVAIAGILLLVLGVYFTARGIRFVAGRMRRPSIAWCAGVVIAGAAALVFLTVMRYLLEF